MNPTPPDRSVLPAAIRDAVSRIDLGEETSYAMACEIMSGSVGDARIAALLVALRMKGETVDEITGFVRALRDHAESVPVAGDEVVDTCGTGGDGKGTFNISTVSALVAAGAGCAVAKHGNRAVSSACGSSDVLEALGVKTDGDGDEAARNLERFGICFLFAPLFHPAARHAAAARREIGVRSLFNIAGPLCNPAGARRQVMGVFAPELTAPVAEVLRRLGSTHCMVVHGDDGLDEITLDGCTRVSELRDGAVRTYSLDPRSIGLARSSLSGLLGGDARRNAEIAREVLDGRPGPAREIVLVNAAAVAYVSGRARSLAAGLELAAESIDSGAARAKLDALSGKSGDE